MASINVNSVTMRKLDEFDIQVLDAGGKTLSYINISVSDKGVTTITYVIGNNSNVIVQEVKGETISQL